MTRARLGWLFWLAMVAACIWLPYHDLYGSHGPFVRQLVHSRPWKGLAECLLLLGVVYAGLRIRQHGHLLAALAVALYTRRHGVDITLALLAAYAAAIGALGRAISGLLRVERNGGLADALRNLALGVVGWSLAIWVLSLAGLGQIGILRVAALAILGPPLLTMLWQLRAGFRLPSRPKSRTGALTAAIFVTAIAMLSAKAATAVDSDALWYGLNADRVLVGEGGLFQPQGLIAHVHYYPKFSEALQIPFMGLGSASLVTGLSLICWVLLAATCRELLREFGVPSRAAWIGALLACAVPAVSASAATPKGELLGAWLCVFAVLAAQRLRRAPSAGGWLGAGLAALILAPLARLTTLPYALAIFVYLIVVAWRARATTISRQVLVPLLTATSVGILVCLRTWGMSGVALSSPEVLVSLQAVLGWRLHDDIGRYAPEFATPFPGGLIDSLFGPSKYIHQALFWMGNAWLPLLIAAASLRGWRWLRAPGLLFCLAIGLAMYALLYTFRYGNDGADGNYFIVPIVLLHLVAFSGAFGVVSPTASDSELTAGVVALVAFSLFVVLTSANWEPGTGRMDANFWRVPWGEMDALADERYEISGMAPLAAALAPYPPTTRMLGDMPVADGGYFPVRYESLGTIAWARPSLLANESALGHMLEDHGIALVALSHDPRAQVDARTRPLMDRLTREGLARQVTLEGGLVDLWILRSVQAGNMTGRTRR